MDDRDEAALTYLLLLLRRLGGVIEITDKELVEFDIHEGTCVVSRDPTRGVVRLELRSVKDDLDAAVQRLNRETRQLLYE